MEGHKICSTIDKNIFKRHVLVNFYSSTLVTKVFRTANTKVICICKLHVLQLQNKFLLQNEVNSIISLCLQSRQVTHQAPPGGVLPEKLGGGVRPASQNPYPIYDQNLRYSLPYLLVVIKDYESEFDAV